jgi:hypothetical protein
MKRALPFFLVFFVGMIFLVSAQTMQQEPTARVFSSRIGGDWLRVERFNLKDDPDGFHPCYTEIRCAYKPVVTRQPDGTYLIQFVSEIAARLP